MWRWNCLLSLLNLTNDTFDSSLPQSNCNHHLYVAMEGELGFVSVNRKHLKESLLKSFLSD